MSKFLQKSKCSNLKISVKYYQNLWIGIYGTYVSETSHLFLPFALARKKTHSFLSFSAFACSLFFYLFLFRQRGPLFVCLSLSILLSLRAPTNQAAAVFAVVFVSMWAGAAVVTINAQLLGGTLSFFQSICVLGYCVFPLMLAAFIIGILFKTPLGTIWLHLIWVAVAFVWSTRASTVFIGQYIIKERRTLAVFPVFFYYTFIGWLVLLF